MAHMYQRQNRDQSLKEKGKKWFQRCQSFLKVLQLLQQETCHVAELWWLELKLSVWTVGNNEKNSGRLEHFGKSAESWHQCSGESETHSQPDRQTIIKRLEVISVGASRCFLHGNNFLFFCCLSLIISWLFHNKSMEMQHESTHTGNSKTIKKTSKIWKQRRRNEKLSNVHDHHHHPGCNFTERSVTFNDFF